LIRPTTIRFRSMPICMRFPTIYTAAIAFAVMDFMGRRTATWRSDTATCAD